MSESPLHCRNPHCPNFGDPSFGEGTCPASHADDVIAPLHLTDPDGDGFGATSAPADLAASGVPDAAVVVSTHENGDWTGCGLTASQVREAIRWMSVAIGDAPPMPAAPAADCPACGRRATAGQRYATVDRYFCEECDDEWAVERQAA